MMMIEKFLASNGVGVSGRVREPYSNLMDVAGRVREAEGIGKKNAKFQSQPSPCLLRLTLSSVTLYDLL